MDKNLFKSLIKEHKQITLKVSSTKFIKATVIYSIDDNGDVYELDEIDPMYRAKLFNIEDDKMLQALYDEVLCDVVSHSLEEHVYHCNECGAELEWNDFNWLTSSYGLCDECYNKLTEEEKEELIEKYE